MERNVAEVGLASGQILETIEADVDAFEQAEPGAWIEATDIKGRTVRVNPMHIEFIRSKHPSEDSIQSAGPGFIAKDWREE